MQAVEAENLRVFFGMIKGDAEFKLFHFMLKYNDLVVATNISGNVITFMGNHLLEGKCRYSRYHATSHGHVRRLNA